MLPNVPLQPEIHYILGKAYFHKGKFYADLAISHLLKARELGYVAADMNEYLGLAYSLVARFGEASDYFLKAVEKNDKKYLEITEGDLSDVTLGLARVLRATERRASEVSPNVA